MSFKFIKEAKEEYQATLTILDYEVLLTTDRNKKIKHAKALEFIIDYLDPPSPSALTEQVTT